QATQATQAARPIELMVALAMAAGAVYLTAVAWCRRLQRSGRGLLVWIMAVGLIARLVTMFAVQTPEDGRHRFTLGPATPIYESDYYRYMWDGAVLARGFNPYAWAPADAVAAPDDAEAMPPELRRLAAESGAVIRRVSYNHLRTIYPPIAQAVFALSHVLRPWSITAWRLVLLAADLATVLLLARLLRVMKLPLFWLVVYWWNPLLIKETFNSAHMDVIALPFVLAALLLAARRRCVWAVVPLALAVGVKIWPIILLPFLVRPLLARPRQLVTAVLIFLALVGAIFLPMLTAGFGETSGAEAYSRHWEMNDSAYLLLLWAVKWAGSFAAMKLGTAHLVTRGLVCALLALWVLWLVRRPIGGPADLCARSLPALAALFLLSPTQFPWYFIWMLPLLAVRPRWSLLLLTALLPIYYLRWRFDNSTFDNLVVWIEYGPVWLLLGLEWWRFRRARRIRPLEPVEAAP
ncbi:MAG: DUF2029 domain-containing protein, partial [Anaerolineaceae bacterium]|nr:DUF2029 domain-containing protein [Anaerolineaceae bacterium]